MTGVATAIGAAAVVGAGASIYSANEAAGATKDASRNAANAELTAQDRAIAQSQPYNLAGQSALPQLQKLLGINTGPGGAMGAATDASTNANTLAALQATPGYQFTKQQGLEATTNKAAAMGLLGSGNTLQALDQFGSGLAQQTYQGQVANLQNLVNTGQGAAAGVAGTIENTGNNLANIAVNQGNNLANIDVNLAAGLSRIGGNLGNQVITNNTLAGLNNPNGAQFTSQDMNTLAGGVPSTIDAGGGYNFSTGYP